MVLCLVGRGGDQGSPSITEIVWVRDSEDLTCEDGSENGEGRRREGADQRTTYSPASDPLNRSPSIGSQSNYMPSLYIL